MMGDSSEDIVEIAGDGGKEKSEAVQPEAVTEVVIAGVTAVEKAEDNTAELADIGQTALIPEAVGTAVEAQAGADAAETGNQPEFEYWRAAGSGQEAAGQQNGYGSQGAANGQDGYGSQGAANGQDGYGGQGTADRQDGYGGQGTASRQNSYNAQGQGNNRQGGYGGQSYSQRPVKHRSAGSIILITLAIIFIGIPFGIPVLCVVLSLFMAVTFTIVGFVIGFGIAGAACTLAGLAATFYGIIKIFTLPYFGACATGAGLLSFGIGIMLILLTVILAGKFLPVVFRGFTALLRLPFGGRRADR